MVNFLNILFQTVPPCSSNKSLTVGESVKKMRYKKIVLTLILTLVLIPTPILMAQETIETPEEELFDPAVMNMIKTQAMTRKQEILKLFGEDPYSTDIENCLNNAEQAMEQAMNFEETNPRAAAEQYNRALRQYRNAYRKYFEEHPELIVEPVETSSASDVIEVPSQEEIESAKEVLLNRFQERYQNRIQVMIENVEDLEDDLSPQDAEKARQALMQTLEKSYRIQERIQNREYDVAVDELDESNDSLDADLDELEDEAAGLMLKSMNRLEARIQKMIGVRAWKAASGVDTTIEDEILEELNGNKKQMKNVYKGNSNGGNGNQGSNGNGGN